MEKPLLTIGLVVRNEEKYLPETLGYLLNQTYKNFLVIISDNASTDKTQEICQEYAKKDPRITYRRQEKNIGTVANWRVVIHATQTPFFMLCGAHDKWDLQFVEKLLPQLVIDQGLILSYSRSGMIETDGSVQRILHDNYTTAHINNSAKRYLFILKHYRAPNIFHGIWRTENLKHCKLDFTSANTDIIMVEQMALEGKFKQYPEVLFWRREVRPDESRVVMIRRQIAAARGISQNEVREFDIHVDGIRHFLQASSIIFRKRYQLSVSTKLWLYINALYFRFLYPNFMLIVGWIIRAVIGKKVFNQLKNFWHRNHYL